MKNNKTTVTVGIPAYNEEANIKYLLNKIINQKRQNYILKEVIVASDGSTDATVDFARILNSKKIKIIKGNKRKGKGFRQNQIAEFASSDILIIMDADIMITNDYLIGLIVRDMKAESADIMSCRKMPVKALTFVEKVVNYSIKIKTELFESLRKNNVYLCNGELIVFKKRLYKTIKWLRI